MSGNEHEEYIVTVPMKSAVECEKSSVQSEPVLDQQDTPVCGMSVVIVSVSSTEEMGHSTGRDSPLPEPSDAQYFSDAAEEQIVLEPVEDEGLADNCSDGDSLGEHEETPLLECLRTVLAALEERRRSQDSDSIVVRDCFQNCDESDENSEHEDGYSACELREIRRSSSPSSGVYCQDKSNEWDPWCGTVNSRHRLQQFRYGPIKYCDATVQPPPRGGIASYYRGTKRCETDDTMSRYMMNSYTRVWPNRSYYRNPKTVHL